jgi:hypothetical protein
VRRPPGSSPGRRPRHTAHLIGGISNRSLRPPVASLIGDNYSRCRCSYGLTRLRLKGSSRGWSIPTPTFSPRTGNVAVFYTMTYNWLLRPVMAADQPPAPFEVRRALRVLDHAVSDYIDSARVAA